MAECTHDCSSCSENCGEKEKARLNEFSSVKKLIAVVSGKGGVGKSFVTALMASQMAKKGYNAAILDADITGPSIPKMLGINEKAQSMEFALLPSRSRGGIDVMSVNLLLENVTDPVIWRGPVISGAVEQFWTDVLWNDIDFMFVDMPPGTGDVPLTVFQSLPIDGIIVVTSPQKLVSMIVEKAVKMAQMMNVPVLGMVENMSYFECPDCHKRYSIFGESDADEAAKQFNIPVVARIPISPEFASMCDEGRAEEIDAKYLDDISGYIEALAMTEA